MAISIKGVNTGVIRKSNNFIALALKIKEPRNKESLFFMSVMELRDLLIALESRLHQKGNDSNLLIVFYVQIMPDDFVMQLHR
ncbi:YjeJ family protein, partial [Escherichia coli]|nr:YjeJ family protein [Escherichia coli]